MGAPKDAITRDALLPLGMFPVMTGEYGTSEGTCVPFAMVAPHDRQAQRNHSQTLQRLAERGGLAPCELVAVLEDREWRRMKLHDAWKRIFELYAAFASPIESRDTFHGEKDYREALEKARDALYNGFEPNNQSRAWHAADDFLREHSTLAIRAPAQGYVIRISPDGRVFWRGREVETDADFGAAMLDLAKHFEGRG